MRRHAKASPAGSTQRQASRLGRFFRGAFTGDESGDADGSGALARRDSTTRHALLAFALSALALLSLAPSADAFKATIFTFGAQGELGGQFERPRGIAVNETGNGGVPAGTVYVADGSEFGGNQRIQALDADGSFLHAWGWDVASAGPGNTGTGFEICVAADGDTCKAGTQGGGAGQFAGVPTDVAVDQASGNVYVTDRGNRRVQVFDADGSFLRAWGWDVASAGPGNTGPGFEICVAADGDTCQAGTQGGGAGQFSWSGGSPGIGVDSSGNVYVADSGNARFQKFSSSGAFLAMAGWDVIVDGSPSDPGEVQTYQVCTVAADCKAGVSKSASQLGPGQFTDFGPSFLDVDPAGDVYAADQNSPGHVHHFTPALGFDPSFDAFTGDEPNAIAVNPVDHHVFLARNPQDNSDVIYEIDPATAEIVESHFPNSGSASWQGLAINPASGRLYAVKTNDRKVSVLEDVPTPIPALDPIEPITGITSEGATFHGSVNPNGVSTGYWFEYRAEGSSTWSKVPSTEVNIGSGNTPVPVSQSVSGLAPPNTEYHVRLAAKISHGVVTSAEETFTTLSSPPTATTAYVAPRTDTTAILNGYVNPLNTPTVFWFEYGQADCSANPCTSVPSSQDASAGAGIARVLVGQEVTGLQPGTTYHYCIVAENSAGTTPCEDRTFTTRTTEEATLPERGIELVNNPDKGNQNAILGPTATDGEKAVWEVAGGAPGGATGLGNAFLAERTPSGWSSRTLVPPAAEQIEAEDGSYLLQATTPDLTKFIFYPGLNFTNRGKSIVRVDANRNQEVLGTYEEFVQTGVALSDDGDHVLAINQDTNQLEDISKPGEPELVGLLPDGSLPECGLDPNGHSFTGVGISVGGAGDQWRPGYQRIAATDASRVYFQVHPNGFCGSSLWQLLVRNRDSEETTEIAAPDSDNALIRATPDGRSVFFVTGVAADPADLNVHVDVYRWDEESGESSCLTCVVPDANLAFTGGEPSRAMVSDDFSHVYFESSAQLTPLAAAGKRNLYALSGGVIRFVATPDDSEGSLDDNDAKLSADGNVLTFKSDVGLSADQIVPACGVGGGLPCTQLFRYDDRDGSLECVSCDHAGITTSRVGSSDPVGEASAFGMSADGETVAFMTGEALVPLDVNNGQDIYEWRGGTQRLITDGVTSFSAGEASQPLVGTVSADGRDIFFTIVAPGLTGFEQDGLSNLYDARIGGGFTPSSPPVHCKEDSCQGPLQAPPPLSQPSSSGFSGRGNVESVVRKRRPCARKRGKAKQRCVRKQRKRSQQARAQANARRTK